MSDTPRTDAVTEWAVPRSTQGLVYTGRSSEMVSAEFARQLERELAEANKIEQELCAIIRKQNESRGPNDSDRNAIEAAVSQFAQCISVLAGQDLTRHEIMVEESRPILRAALLAIKNAAPQTSPTRESVNSASLETNAPAVAAPLDDKMVTKLARNSEAPKYLYDTQGARMALSNFAQAVRRFDATLRSPSDG